MNFAIVLAAGASQRMKGIDKLFYLAKNKPLMVYTLQTLEKHPQIKKIVLVAKKDKIKKVKGLVKKYKMSKVALIVPGGQERQDSSFCGLSALRNLGVRAEDIVLFHNGANPLVSSGEISRVIEAGKKYGAAVLAQPLKDTLKRAGKKGFIAETLDRRKFFLAQTPQAIKYALAKKAFEAARSGRFIGTDDVSLVERLGKKVKIVPCSYRNIKATTPDDLEIVKSFIK